MAGRYEPAVIGLNGVKWYAWAPKYFVSDFNWNQTPETIFLPLYYLDIKFWHTEHRSYMDIYPINEVPVEEIWKVYQAWQ